uniref:Uncharacterized protein n=1 Tax=Podarcis muralis TaxID=64176 RepID=A0A670J9H4_PODMU
MGRVQIIKLLLLLLLLLLLGSCRIGDGKWESHGKAQIVLQFLQMYIGSAREWFTLDFVHIQQDNKETAIFTAPSISGPAEYSFHCQLVGTSDHYGATLTPSNAAAKEWQVVISEFQIQAFSVEGHKFSYASDCTTFFTPGIWMGLVSSLVLLLILTFGIHMIVNLTTNNRFDDPKDQPLSVPQGEYQLQGIQTRSGPWCDGGATLILLSIVLMDILSISFPWEKSSSSIKLEIFSHCE